MRKRKVRRVRARKNSGDVITGKPANFNRRKTKAIEGDHLIQCDVTGQVCLRSEARMTWRGLLVSNQNWDVKHPQLTIRVPPEDISIPDARPFKGADGGGLSVAEFQQDPTGGWNDSGLSSAAYVQITDKEISSDENFPTYRLTHQGIAIAGDDGVVDDEWWSQSPLPIETIGQFYQVKAKLLSNDSVEISGIFDQYINLQDDREWTITGGTGTAIVEFKIRELFTGTIKDTANITFTIGYQTTGWDPTLEYQNILNPATITYTDNNRIATVTTIASGEGDEAGIASGAIRSTGKKYVEFKLLTRLSEQFGRFCLVEAGLMPARLIIGSLGGFINGFAQNNGGAFETPTQVAAYENETELTNTSPFEIGDENEVLAMAIDFEGLTVDYYLDNVLQGSIGPGAGNSFGSLQPYFSVFAKSYWSIRIQEYLEDQDFTPPLGYEPWSTGTIPVTISLTNQEAGSSYTLQSDGIAVSGGFDITGQWASTSPVSVPGYGDSFNVEATSLANVGLTLSGTFGILSLSSTRTWEITSGFGEAQFSVEIGLESAIIVLANESVFITSESFSNDSDPDASYSLGSDGVLTTIPDGIIDGEWWTDEAGSVPGIGDLYEVRASDLDMFGTVGYSGTFDTWTSLSTTQTWALNAGPFGSITFLVEIRRASTGEVVDTATITLNYQPS